MTNAATEEAMHDMLRLVPGQVHLWTAFSDDIAPSLLERYRRELLCEDERRTELTFYFARDRRQYLITRALVRCVLSRYCPQPARDWGFGKTVHGRPVILSPSENARQLSFNISHCAGMVLVGVARGGRLGVDTESLVRGDDFVAIGRCCFAADEVSVLESLPDELRRWRYASYWTLKEAYVKATGLGLTIPLNSFGFRMPTDEQIDPWFDEQVENTVDLHFSLFRPCASHVAAVCCQVASGVMPQLQMRNMVPLASERLIDCALLARSAMACVDGSGVKSVLP